MKVLKRIIFVFALLSLQLSFVQNVAAVNINIDGRFNDWNSVAKTSIDSQFYSEVAFVKQDNKLYMYAKENGTNSWENYYSNTRPTLILSDNTEIHLVITEKSSSGNNSELEVRKENGYSVISGSAGKRTKNGKYMYELVIPLENLGDVDSVRIYTDYSNTQTIKVKSMDETTNQTTHQATTVQPTTLQPTSTAVVITTRPADGAIIIDGHYDDWSVYPHCLKTNWNMPEDQRTENNCRSVALVVDDDNIYFHVKMIAGWEDQFNGNEFEISVGEHKLTVELRFMDGSAMPRHDNIPGIYELQVWYKNRVPGHGDDATVEGSEAALTITKNHPDEVEVKIPKEVFNLIFGMDISDIREVTLANPNLFDEPVSSSATPTYAFVGIAVCILSVLIVLAIVYVRKRKLLGSK